MSVQNAITRARILENVAKDYAHQHNISNKDFFDMWRGVFTSWKKYPWNVIRKTRSFLLKARDIRIHHA